MDHMAPANDTRFKPVTDLSGAEQGMPALVLGNSPWRVGFPVAAWAGVTIGCNGVYREGYDLDYLVTVDRGIVKEVAAWKPWDHGVKQIISQAHNWPKGVDVGADVYYASGSILWQKLAGNLALGVAMVLGCNPIVMVGFSMDGTNTYIGTKNYRHREPGRGKCVPGADKRHQIAIRARLEELNADNFDVFWVAPGLEMLDLLNRPTAGTNAKA